jgi:hypothetical protein
MSDMSTMGHPGTPFEIKAYFSSFVTTMSSESTPNWPGNSTLNS